MNPVSLGIVKVISFHLPDNFLSLVYVISVLILLIWIWVAYLRIWALFSYRAVLLDNSSGFLVQRLDFPIVDAKSCIFSK
jgi:hypothetical protein